jgi:hypothetical protein
MKEKAATVSGCEYCDNLKRFNLLPVEAVKENRASLVRHFAYHYEAIAYLRGIPRIRVPCRIRRNG